MSQDEYIKYLADKVASAEIDFERVRKELERHGLNKVQTKLMIRLVDHEVQSRAVARTKRERGSSYLIVGSLMVITGLISILAFGGTIIVYFIGYAPFTTGMALIVAGRREFLKAPRSRNVRMREMLRGRLRT